ncbi:uncharacterized protein BDR25DRAFT_396594 [Lindgomyces ingoldianus]|uniref:Uncharacterized protein n=1 Tax=Lindgomyces ingoldianus TaxID=673940 RepID=A0ACB6QEZ5_9PLEO|nr:uncharacterized protein BDR25DRAFT_396594 [Lindgomyces ingoldianus]KAF2464720.1 hypothetical protein BDR25DRAFT_396594 [Lindgomyces ingoldianus]
MARKKPLGAWGRREWCCLHVSWDDATRFRTTRRRARDSFDRDPTTLLTPHAFNCRILPNYAIMARTRSKPVPKASSPEPAASTRKPLPASTANPPKLFVLPKDTSKDARIVTLNNPATANPSRYLFCPEKGFHEFTRIAAPKKAPSSWLITSSPAESEGEYGDAEKSPEENTCDEGTGIGSGYITKSSDLFIATPIDILFMILPALVPKSAKDTKQHFLSLDDHLDNLTASSAPLKALLQHPSLKDMIAKRLENCCDTVDAGDEKMYRLSNEKLLELLVKKAERMCAKRLPPSMEDKFIKPALEIPIMSIKREESSISLASETVSNGIDADNSQGLSTSSTNPDSQTTTLAATTSTTATSISTSEEISQHTLLTPPEVPHLLRLRTSLTYLLSSYISPTLRLLLLALLKDPTSPTSSHPDFTPLEAHLSVIAKLKSEAAALRSISDNISRKRGFEDDEKVAEREEKKRKKEEEEKRKKSESRGIKQLKKVDTSGMKKLSSFFTKAPVKKIGIGSFWVFGSSKLGGGNVI